MVSARCGAKAGCTAETSFGWWVVQVRGPSTTFRGLPCMLCFVSLAPAQKFSSTQGPGRKKTRGAEKEVEKKEEEEEDGRG